MPKFVAKKVLEYDLIKKPLEKGLTFMSFKNSETGSQELTLTGRITSDLISKTYNGVESFLFDFAYDKKFYLHCDELLDEVKDFKRYPWGENNTLTLKPKEVDGKWNFVGTVPDNGEVCTITLKPGVWVNSKTEQWGCFFKILEIR